MSVSPPKCRTCGKAEWGHVCGSVGTKLKAKPAAKPKRRKYHREYYDRVRRKKLGYAKRGVESVESASAKTQDS